MMEVTGARENRLKIDSRRRQIKLLIEAGMTEAQIAEKLDVGTATVERDVRAIRDDPAFRIDQPAAVDTLRKLLQSNALAKETLWSLALSKDTDEKVRVRALTEISTVNERTARLLQMYGMLPSDKTQNIFAAPGSVVQVNNVTIEDLGIVITEMVKDESIEVQDRIIGRLRSLVSAQAAERARLGPA